MSNFMTQEIRNFVIIAHIDHGKSTLADRFLELTKTVPSQKMREQFLDMMELERERGITIKLQPVRMEFEKNNIKYVLNLIDTPGHVDFSYEVSRSLNAVEGAILLVDATKGIQAQTLANLELAKRHNLEIIPVINKIDLPQAQIEKTEEEIEKILNLSKKEIIKISAKKGENVEEVLKKILEKIPPPKIDLNKPFRALIFDSQYDPFKGVIAFVRIMEGEVEREEEIFLAWSKTPGKIKELGFFKPEFFPQKKLRSGEIGYIATGIKEPEKVRIGDTIMKLKDVKEKDISPLPGYQEPKPVVFASLYPKDNKEFEILKNALSKLKLNDPALYFEPEHKEILGQGFRCGFLGSLHLEIVIERLKREFGLELVVSFPSVVYKIIDKKGKEALIYSPRDWPPSSEIEETKEPYVKLEIITLSKYISKVFEILPQSKYLNTEYLTSERIVLNFELPLREILVGFYDKLMAQTQGFSSMSYEILGYKKSNLKKVEFWIAGEKEEAFSKILPEEKAFKESKEFLKKLKKILPPQQFPVILQAKIDKKVIARETIKALRKDVLAPLYGGDYTRKKKLLEKQKRGKKKLKERGKVKIPSGVYLKILS